MSRSDGPLPHLASAHPNMASPGLDLPSGPRLRSGADGSPRHAALFYGVTAVWGGRGGEVLTEFEVKRCYVSLRFSAAR